VGVEIERRADSEPELGELVTDDRLHGFFVKNLESVQGDERDIIIMSVGYGPDENGKLTMNFGPINRAGGERRLNVAITRARNRVEIVSSITGADIRSTTPSVSHFARYLNFAENGISALAIDLEGSQGDAESPFEEEVNRSIRALGYEPVPQVGVAGYRIDIGIRHPDQPGAYLLGVECDGASYHSSRVARDRDRIRQEILEGLGWRLHRIWSTAWFQSRGEEENKLREAIENAAKRRQRRSRTSSGPVVSPQIEIETVDLDRPPSWVIQYTEPKASSPGRGHQNFIDDSSRPIISRQIQEIIDSDGPIHSEVVLRAIRRAWNVGRVGDRIWRAFNQALHFLVRRGEIEESGGFLSLPGQIVEVRGALGAGVEPRTVDEVSPQELQLAIHRLLEDVAGQVERIELLTKWRSLFGWRRAGTNIEIAFQEALNALVDQEKIDTSWSE
jgi:very-short-patch-repair endonuclease